MREGALLLINCTKAMRSWELFLKTGLVGLYRNAPDAGAQKSLNGAIS